MPRVGPTPRAHEHVSSWNDSTRAAEGGYPAAGGGGVNWHGPPQAPVLAKLTVLYHFVPFQPMFCALARKENVLPYRHGQELPTESTRRHVREPGRPPNVPGYAYQAYCSA
eukprot:2769898-Prymnesium_polylepis.1